MPARALGKRSKRYRAFDLRVIPTGQPIRRMRQCAVMRRTKRCEEVTPVDLQKGQVWVMDDQELSIIRTGKRLVEFRLLKRGSSPRTNKLSRSSLETLPVVQKFLENNCAVLKEPIVATQNN